MAAQTEIDHARRVIGTLLILFAFCVDQRSFRSQWRQKITPLIFLLFGIDPRRANSSVASFT